MKKLIRLLFIFFGIILAFQTTTKVQAIKGYEIDKYNVNANVQKNGDVALTQRISYAYKDGFHGVYYNQDIRNTSGTSNPQVYYEVKGVTYQLKQADTGKNNTYKVTKNKKVMKIKVYHYALDGVVTYIYKYKIFGLITNYSDTAALNWKIIGNGWYDDLNNVKLTINLPEKNVSKLQAWTHGSLTGNTTVDKKNGRVIMTMKQNEANKFVESHMIFPTTVTPLNTKIVRKNAKAGILKREGNLARQANAKRRHLKEFYYGFIILGVAIILGNYFYHFRNLYRHPANKHSIPTPLYHLFDEPKFSPSMTQVILEHKEKATSLSLMADLLAEVSQHRMKIEKYGKESFEITALVPPTNFFYKYLFDNMGDGKTVKLATMRMYAQGNDEEVDRKFDDWAKQAAAGHEKYLDQHNVDINKGFLSASVVTTVTSFIMFLLAVLFQKNLLLAGIIWLVVAIASWLVYYFINKHSTSYTDLGEIEVNKIRAFKRMLEDINDIKLAEVGDLVLWESFLPYAVVFGISDKVIRAIRVNFGAQRFDSSPLGFCYISNIGTARKTVDFQSSFIYSLGAGGSSSIMGGSGGFSGVSSGGAGGGSGGGAF